MQEKQKDLEEDNVRVGLLLLQELVRNTTTDHVALALSRVARLEGIPRDELARRVRPLLEETSTHNLFLMRDEETRARFVESMCKEK